MSSSKSSLSSYQMQKLHQRRKRNLQEKLDGLSQDQISHISLHEDLNNFKPKGHDILPDKIFEKLRQAHSERTLPSVETKNNTCSALVLYRPPEALLFDINRRKPSQESMKSVNRSKDEFLKSNIPFQIDSKSAGLTEPCIEVEMSE